MSRVDAFWPFVQLRREISQLLDGLEGNGGTAKAGFPAVNIWEDRDNFYAEAEIAGVAQSDLEVFTIGDELTVRGKRPAEPESALTYHRRERGVGEFERVIRLPADVNADNVQAKLHNGVLTITMPKAEQAKPRKIIVNAG